MTGLSTAPTHLHPLTPVARGGRVAAPLFFALAFFSRGDLPGGPLLQILLLVVATLVIGAVVAGFAYLAWVKTTYWFDDDGDFRVASGVLQRQERRVQLSRLQAVEVAQPIIPRLLGLAELRPEVAGGESGKVALEYLTIEQAHALRNELLARAAGIRTDGEQAAPEAPERVLVRVPNKDLALSLIINEMLILGVVIGSVVMVVTYLSQGFAGLLGLLLAIGIPGVSAANGFLANFDFTVAESPDGLRLRRGLLSTRSQTVPPGRVQAVEIAQPFLWRSHGWVRLRVNVAGYEGGSDDGGAGSTVLLPVAPVLVANAVLARVMPGVEVEQVPLVPVPSAARRRAWIQYPRLAAGHDEKVFVARTGRIVRRLSVIPHVRTQSVRVTQGPWERALGLASMHVDSTPGPVTVSAVHRDVAEAHEMAHAQAARATAARRVAAPERWMEERMRQLRIRNRVQQPLPDVDDERAGAS